MGSYYLITDQIVRVADDLLGRLLFDFMIPEDQVKPGNVVCTLYRAEDTHMHGVRSLPVTHPVSRIFTYDLDPWAVLAADEDYQSCTVFTTREHRLLEALLAGVYSRLIFDRTVFVHGALINVDGYGGILFIGDSGVGKTTQAVLWEKHRNAEIINGDKVFLALRDDAPGEALAYGSPWRGSSPYCVNKRVPLRAIVSLIRRDAPSIRLVQEPETTALYLPRVFLPGWDDRLTDMVMATMDELLPMVPVFEMSCLPDESAVEMLERVLMRRP